MNREGKFIEGQPLKDSRRMIQLDVLRSIAILLVLGSHYVIGPKQAGALKVPATLWHRFGFSGVDLFFVLSGFLVGGLLMRELRVYGKLDVRRFLIRRGLKIWPVYYLYMLVVAIFLFVTKVQFARPLYEMLVPYVLNLQNYNIMHLPYGAPMISGHTWSLAVEEHFYLSLPLLLLFLSSGNKRRLAWIPFIGIGLDIVCLLLRLRLVGRPFEGWTQVMPTHLRIDSLFTGVVLAYWYHFRPEVMASLARYRALLLIAGALLVSPMAIWPIDERPFVWTYGFTCLSLGYACLLIVCVMTPVGEGALGRWFHSRTARALAYMGAFSYSIYIWHIDFIMVPIKDAVTNGLLGGLPAPIRWSVLMAAYMAIAIGAGILLARLTERPALLLRDKLFPARVDALGGVSAANAAPVTREENLTPEEA